MCRRIRWNMRNEEKEKKGTKKKVLSSLWEKDWRYFWWKGGVWTSIIKSYCREKREMVRGDRIEDWPTDQPCVYSNSTLYLYLYVSILFDCFSFFFCSGGFPSSVSHEAALSLSSRPTVAYKMWAPRFQMLFRLRSSLPTGAAAV